MDLNEKQTQHVQINLRVETDDLRFTKENLRSTLLKVNEVQPQSIEIEAGEQWQPSRSTR